MARKKREDEYNTERKSVAAKNIASDVAKEYAGRQYKEKDIVKAYDNSNMYAGKGRSWNQSNLLPQEMTMAKQESKPLPVLQPSNGKNLSERGFYSSHEIPSLSKPSTRYQNENATNSAPTTSRDKSFDKDFDEFHKYRVGEYLDRRDYDPTTDQDVEHWRNLKQDIMSKNKWSEQEFDKRWEDYYTERAQKEAEEYVNDSVKFTEKHPVLGSLLSLADTAGTWMEGGASAVEGLLSHVLPEDLKDKYIRDSATDPGFTYTRQREAVRNTVKNKIDNGIGELAYDTAMGLPEMAAGALAMASQSAGSSQMQALERGIDRDKAAQTGLASGIASYIANKIGIEKALGAQGKTVLSSIGKGAVSEGLENVVEDLVNTASDLAINLDKSQVRQMLDYYKAQGMSDNDAVLNTVGEYLKQEATSFGSGAVFGGLMNASTAVPELRALANNALTKNRVKNNNADIAVNGNAEESVPMISAKSDADMKAQKDAIAEQLFRVANGEMRPDEYVKLGETPTYMAKYGDVNNPLVMAQDTVNKIAYPEGYMNGSHNLGYEPIADIQNQLNNPVVAMESKTQPNSGVIMTDMLDENGFPVIAPIHMDRDTSMGKANVVASMYGKENAGSLINESNVDFQNKERTADVLSGNGLQLSDLKAQSDPIFNSRIGQDTNNVNSETARNEQLAELTNAIEQKRAELESIPKKNKKKRQAKYDELQALQQQARDLVNNRSSVEITQQSVNSQNANSPQMPILRELQNNVGEITAQDVNSQGASDDFEMLNNTGLEQPKFDPNDFIITETVEPAERGFVQNGVSRVPTNTGINADIITRYEYENDPVLQEIAKYAKHSNDVTYENAFNNVKENGANLLNDYLYNDKKIDNDQDVDQAMILLQNLTEQMRNGETSLKPMRDLLFSRLRKSGTQYGQFIQAFAKWNDTADGALINGQRILQERVNRKKSSNKKLVNTNKRIAEKIAEISASVDYDGTKITNGSGYSQKKSNPNATSGRLDRSLKNMGYDGTMESQRAPKTHEQHRVEVENSIKKELGSVANQLNENDYDVLTNFVENNVPVDIITDELEHRFNHGTWYTIDESTPVKKQVSRRLSNIFAQMGNDGRKAKNANAEKPIKSHATFVDEARNTLDDEAVSLGLGTDTDVEFLATMLEENIPNWLIEDEIRYRLEHGEWYSLDESIEQPRTKIDQQVKSALDSLVAEENVAEQPELSREELRQRIRNTVDNEMASAGISRLYTDLGEFTDADVDYIANLKENGATTQEIADALNTKFLTGTFDVSLETQNAVNQLFEEASKYDPNSKQACEAKATAYKLIADETVGDASPLEKFEAWRYLAMLGNPKTMLRNLVGNTMFNAVTSTSNSMSAVMEAGLDRLSRTKLANKLGIDGIQRTKSVLNPFSESDKALTKGAWKDSNEHMYAPLQGEKYEKSSVQDKIKRSKSVFNRKLTQLYEKATDLGISDSLAVRSKYSTALAGYLKANGYDASVFDLDNTYRGLRDISRNRVLTDAERAQMDNAKQSYDALEKARDYALKQAEYATFHEDNEVAKLLTKWSKEARNSENPFGRGMGYLIEGTVPFKKTPANILRSGVEYSPLGAIKSIADTGRLIYENTGNRKGNLEDTYTKTSKITGKEKTRNKLLLADVLDDWSKALTGTGLMALGYYLKNKGIVNSSTDEEKYQDQLEGIQNYSITINGKTYTLDWAAPAVMPLLMGAELSKLKERNSMLDKDWYENMDEILGTVNSLLDPILETSMMQGVKNTLESAANEVKYNENGAVGGILGSMLTNSLTGYASQALPTLSGQIARTVDPYRRATDTKAETSFGAGVEKQLRKTMNKIPGLSMLNEKYRDAYGRTQKNSPSDNYLLNFLYQSLMPAYIDEIEQTDADKSARATYNAYVPNDDGKYVPQLDEKVFAQWKSKVSVNGEKLNPEQMSEYRKASGNANLAIRNALANEDWFNELDGQKRASVLKSVNTLVDKIGKEEVGYPQDDKALDALHEGGIPSLLDYYRGKQINKQIEEQTGLSSSSKAAKEIKEDILSGNIESANQKMSEAIQKQEEAKPYSDLAETLGTDAKTVSQVANYAGDNWNAVESELPVLKGMGLSNYSQYAHAVNYASSNGENIDTQWFADQTKLLDTDKSGGVNQEELKNYFNDNGLSENEVMRLWGMFALGKDGAETKAVPYIITRGANKGKWGYK